MAADEIGLDVTQIIEDLNGADKDDVIFTAYPKNNSQKDENSGSVSSRNGVDYDKCMDYYFAQENLRQLKETSKLTNVIRNIEKDIEVLTNELNKHIHSQQQQQQQQQQHDE